VVRIEVGLKVGNSSNSKSLSLFVENFFVVICLSFFVVLRGLRDCLEVDRGLVIDDDFGSEEARCIVVWKKEPAKRGQRFCSMIDTEGFLQDVDVVLEVMDQYG